MRLSNETEEAIMNRMKAALTLSAVLLGATASAPALATPPSRTVLKIKAALIRLMIAPSVSFDSRMLAKTPGCRSKQLSQIVTCATGPIRK